MNRLNIGCGKDIRTGYINLDLKKLPGVDVVHNLNKIPYPFKDNYFDEIICYNVLEHMDNFLAVVEELYRISKNGAIIQVEVPFFHSLEAFADPTHKNFFTLDTFDYLTKDHYFNYYSHVRFEVLEKKLIPTFLGRMVPLPIRNFTALVFGQICKGIHFKLKVIK